MPATPNPDLTLTLIPTPSLTPTLTPALHLSTDVIQGLLGHLNPNPNPNQGLLGHRQLVESSARGGRAMSSTEYSKLASQPSPNPNCSKFGPRLAGQPLPSLSPPGQLAEAGRP